MCERERESDGSMCQQHHNKTRKTAERTRESYDLYVIETKGERCKNQSEDK